MDLAVVFRFFLRSLILVLFASSSSLALAEDKVVLFLGDSITAGYGVQTEDAYPSLLAKSLKGHNMTYAFVNAAESGSLSSSLMEHLKFHVSRREIAVVVIASGGNDARQGTSTREIEKNLEDVIRFAQRHKIKVLLAGMKIFTNYGKDYGRLFAELYPRLAKRHRVALMPFLLDGVAGVSSLNQRDGFHPNKKGHEKIAQQMAPHLRKLL